MISRAEAKYLRISPTKVKPVIHCIKGEKVNKALFILGAVNKKAAYLLKKVLQSAIVNAKNKGYDENKLFISKVIANQGPVFKRFRSATFGRAVRIRKRTAHILIELDAADKALNDVLNK